MPRVLSLLSVLFLLLSCSAEGEVCSFVRRDDLSAPFYTFTVDMSDSSASYDISLLGRASRGPVNNLELKIRWIAPSGESFVDRVYMKTITAHGDQERYWSGVVPRQNGIWKVAVLPGDGADGLLGMGLICKKNGTR